MAEIQGFDWDAGPSSAKSDGSSSAKTASNRYLVVVFTVRRKLFRTVTAYGMNAAERRRYAPQID